MLGSCIDFLKLPGSSEADFSNQLLSYIKGQDISASYNPRDRGFFFSPKLDESVNEIIEKIKKVHHINPDYLSVAFRGYLNDLAIYFKNIFGSVFDNDTVRFRVCVHNEGAGSGAYYRPFVQYPIEGEKDRIYPWLKANCDKAITGEAYSSDKPKIYTLNKGLVEFEVKNWQDFIVMAPRTLLDIQPYPDSDEVFPVLSFVFSVKLDKEKIRGKSFKETKKMFKEMCNKLYLLEYIGVDHAIKNSIKDFLSLYPVKSDGFLDYIKSLPVIEDLSGH